VYFALLIAFCLAACTGTPKREAASLADAVDGYRRANSALRAARAQAVGTVECSDAEVCSAKSECLAAVEPTTRALALKDEVAARLTDIESKRLAPDAPEAQALPGKLDEASRLLEAGRVKMANCDKLLTDLRVKYAF
jgi:hypothetical protein